MRRAPPVRNEFHSLADGSPYELNPLDDSETELYRAVGETRTLAQLSELMITVSSNLATNLLMEKLGVDNIRGGVHALGADGMNVRGGVEDNKAFAQGLNNTTTARALLRLLDGCSRPASGFRADRRHHRPALQRYATALGSPFIPTVEALMFCRLLRARSTPTAGESRCEPGTQPQ